MTGATYCPACAARYGAGVQSEAERLARQPYRAHYSSAEFLTNRPLVLQRAHGRCEWPGCGRAIGREAHDWECDHIVPVRDDGTDDMSNLQALCVEHARAKTRLDRRARRERMGR